MKQFAQMDLLECIGTDSSIPFPKPDTDSVAWGVYTRVFLQAFSFPLPPRSAL